VTIDEEFQKLIPPLTDDEYRQLEENCIKEGIREAILVWDRGDDLVIVDGHNRYKIAREHNLKWNHKVMNFESREDAKEWIIKNQFGRRNLTPYDRSLLALKLKPLITEKAKANQVRSTENRVCQKSDKQKVDTKKELAKVAGVSHDTIHKVEKIEAEATPQVKQAVRDGKLSINQAYNSTFPKVLDPVREAKEEHEEFREKVKDGVVEFADVKKDEINQRIIYHDFVRNLYKPLTAVNGFGLLYQTKDMEKMIAKIPNDLAENLVFKIDHCIKILELVRTTIERRANEKH